MSDRKDSHISLSLDFQAFKDQLQAKSLLTSPIDLGINDDTTLLRFFSARKHNIQAAVTQYASAHEIREANHVKTFCSEMDIQSSEETRSLYPQWTGRLCKKGQPLCTFDTAKLSAEAMARFKQSSAKLSRPASETNSNSAARLSTEALRSFLVFDELSCFTMPLCSTLAAKPISKMVIIADISSLSLSQIWNLKTYLQDFSKTLSTSFPETLDKVFVTGASAAFPTIWKLVKRWADPETAEKIVVLSAAEEFGVLSEYIEVKDIPEKNGGGGETGLDSRIEGLLEWVSSEEEKQFPPGMLKWETGSDGNVMKAVAVAGEDGVLKATHFATLRNPRI